MDRPPQQRESLVGAVAIPEPIVVSAENNVSDSCEPNFLAFGTLGLFSLAVILAFLAVGQSLIGDAEGGDQAAFLACACAGGFVYLFRELRASNELDARRAKD